MPHNSPIDFNIFFLCGRVGGGVEDLPDLTTKSNNDNNQQLFLPCLSDPQNVGGNPQGLIWVTTYTSSSGFHFNNLTQILDQPLILVKDKQWSVFNYCFSDCRHKWIGLLRIYIRNHLGSFILGYHLGSFILHYLFPPFSSLRCRSIHFLNITVSVGQKKLLVCLPVRFSQLSTQKKKKLW